MQLRDMHAEGFVITSTKSQRINTEYHSHIAQISLPTWLPYLDLYLDLVEFVLDDQLAQLIQRCRFDDVWQSSPELRLNDWHRMLHWEVLLLRSLADAIVGIQMKLISPDTPYLILAVFFIPQWRHLPRDAGEELVQQLLCLV